MLPCFASPVAPAPEFLPWRPA